MMFGRDHPGHKASLVNKVLQGLLGPWGRLEQLEVQVMLARKESLGWPGPREALESQDQKEKRVKLDCMESVDRLVNLEKEGQWDHRDLMVLKEIRQILKSF